MFDFDAGKLVIIGIVALVVIGPKDLPRVMRQVGQAIGKMRRLAADFQGQFMEAMREADVADIKADVAKLADSAKLDVDFNPVREIRNHVTAAVDGPASTPAAADAPHMSAADETAFALDAATAVTESAMLAGPLEPPSAPILPAAAEPVLHPAPKADAHHEANEASPHGA